MNSFTHLRMIASFRIVPRFALMLTVLLAYASKAHAVVYYWDTDGAIAGAGGGTTPNGTWSSGGTTWSTDSTGSSATGAVTTTISDSGTFSAGNTATGNYTVTLSGTQTIKNVTFEDGTVLITGDDLNVSGTTFTVNSGITAQIDSNIVGATVIKAGAGTLTLTGVNTYTSQTLATAGTLNLNGTHNNGQFFTTGTSVVNINGSETVSNTFIVSNASAGVSTVNVSSGGVLNITGGSTLIGQQNNLADATLHIKNGGVVTASITDFRVGNGSNGFSTTGTLTLDPGSALTFSSPSSVIRVANGNATTGTINLDGGTLSVGQIRGDAPASAGAGNNFFNFNGGTLRAVNGVTSFLQGMDRANVRNGGAVIDTNGLNNTIAQALLHSNIGGDAAVDGGLTKLGNGTLTLTGANAYTGDTDIQDGVLSINSAYLDDMADVLLTSGAMFNLNFVGIDTINRLYFDGFAQAKGTWGSTSSIAANQNDTFFSGTGVLLVTSTTPEPSSAVLAVLCLASYGFVGRRRGRRS